jgi:Fur family ferric uptake transcriptional regulator
MGSSYSYLEVGEFTARVIRHRTGRAMDGIAMTAPAVSPPLAFESPVTVLNALRAQGLWISAARRLVIETLFAAAAPVSAEEIAGGLGGRRMSLDLASVYRNLETLETLGVVRHFHAGHGPGRYVLAGCGEREYLASSHCGDVIEADPRQLDGARAEIRARFGFEAAFTHFPIVGTCPACSGGGEG